MSDTEIVEAMERPAIRELKMVNRAVRQLENQSALHGLVGETVDIVMAENPRWMVDFFLDFPEKAIPMLVKLSPSLIPIHGMQGDVNITINGAIQPTELDVVDEQ